MSNPTRTEPRHWNGCDAAETRLTEDGSSYCGTCGIPLARSYDGLQLVPARVMPATACDGPGIVTRNPMEVPDV